MTLVIATFRMLDAFAVVLYLGATAMLALYFARRAKTTEHYFVGNRSYPGWVIGVSMLSTSISSITFLALPAAAFALDWRMLMPNAPLPLVLLLAIFVFIPIFRRGPVTSAFEYLEERFGPLVRLYAAMSFIMLQLIRVGSVLFLVSLPVAELTGLSVPVVIILTGIFIAFYTVTGGIEAVIWTDVIQAFVLWGGGIIALVIILFQLPGGWELVFEVGHQHGKFGIGPMDWDMRERTLYVMLIYGTVHWINGYTADQNIVQRFLAARSMHEARKATLISVLLSLTTWTFFFFIGTSLYVYYQTVRDYPAGISVDRVFPHFILSQLPVGLSGLILAAVLAAAMSSLDSNINATATITVVDLLKRYLARGRDDRFYLKAARWIATFVAACMIAVAMLMYRLPKESMADVLNIVGSVFGGAVAGMFLLGIFTTRVGYQAVLCGLLPAIAANVFFALNATPWWPQNLSLPIHSYWTIVFVNLIFLIAAYAAAGFCGGKTKDLRRLTVWTLDAQTPVPIDTDARRQAPAPARIERS